MWVCCVFVEMATSDIYLIISEFNITWYKENDNFITTLEGSSYITFVGNDGGIYSDAGKKIEDNLLKKGPNIFQSSIPIGENDSKSSEVLR